MSWKDLIHARTEYSDRIAGVISCFDRMLFKCYLPIGWYDAREVLLSRQGLLIKDFGKYRELSMADVEQEQIPAMLEHTGCNKSKASAILGIERSTLDRKLNRYHVPRSLTE